MLGYSRNREDFIQKLARKYREKPFYTVSKSNMKEFIYIYGEDCPKCHQLKPHVEMWCSKNWYTFKAMQYADSWLEISSIPMAQIIDENWEQILDMEWIVNFISNHK